MSLLRRTNLRGETEVAISSKEPRPVVSLGQGVRVVVSVGTSPHREFDFSTSHSSRAPQYWTPCARVIPIETASRYDDVSGGGSVQHRAQLIRGSPEPALESAPAQATEDQADDHGLYEEMVD
jgi:hypothetical protein